MFHDFVQIIAIHAPTHFQQLSFRLIKLINAHNAYCDYRLNFWRQLDSTIYTRAQEKIYGELVTILERIFRYIISKCKSASMLKIIFIFLATPLMAAPK